MSHTNDSLYINTPVPRQKAFLIGVCIGNDDYEMKEASLDELERLADTADIETVGKFIQCRKDIDKATYAGKGFLEDIVNKMAMAGADFLIFDNELAPTQGRNIQKRMGINCIDRTEVILDIFHHHAKTREAKLQVRLAELKYQLPRLKKLWSHLDRERGSSGSAGGASRGMGEKQIQIDRRIIDHEIKRCNIALKKIMSQKIIQRKVRNNSRKVCLVGYTNAGKSTLFNKLTGAGVLVEDKLFATLDSTARRLELEKGSHIVLSDTVGFISNLPHNLVASFRATLKDVADADLLLHVIDISDNMCEKYMEEVDKVLEEMKVAKIPKLIVFNKVDKLPEYRVRAEIFEDKYPNSIIISAHAGENVDLLLQKIDKALNKSSKYKLFIPFSAAKKVAYVHSYGKVISEEYKDDGVKITAVINNQDIYEVEQFIVSKKVKKTSY